MTSRSPGEVQSSEGRELLLNLAGSTDLLRGLVFLQVVFPCHDLQEGFVEPAHREGRVFTSISCGPVEQVVIPVSVQSLMIHPRA